MSSGYVTLNFANEKNLLNRYMQLLKTNKPILATNINLNGASQSFINKSLFLPIGEKDGDKYRFILKNKIPLGKFILVIEPNRYIYVIK